MQTVASGHWINKVVLTICILWAGCVLGVGTAAFVHKPWGHDQFVRSVPGQLAHCKRPAVAGQVQSASYNWREIAECPPENLVPSVEPRQEFMYGRMLATAFVPAAIFWLLAYLIAGIVRLAASRQPRSTT